MKMHTLLALLAIGLLAFGCAAQSAVQQNVSSQNTSQQNSSLSGQNASVGDENASSGAPQVEINVTARQWEFVPNTITVKKGDHVIIHITSEDVAHGFMVKDYEINTRIEPGQTATVDFIANKSGEFGFRCSVQCGEGHSEQTGKLIVEP